MAREVSFLTVDKKGRATLPEAVRTELGVEAGMKQGETIVVGTSKSIDGEEALVVLLTAAA